MDHEVGNAQTNEGNVVPVAQVSEVVPRTILVKLEELIEERIEYGHSHQNEL